MLWSAILHNRSRQIPLSNPYRRSPQKGEREYEQRRRRGMPSQGLFENAMNEVELFREEEKRIEEHEEEEEELRMEEGDQEEEKETEKPDKPNPEPDDSYGEGESEDSSDDKDEYVLVKMIEIRKEFMCPICLGIIRKTRTVMECLHRFCRGCIDKSMRLGNNECPACRTHCASRRSLRDDPNYDALISALYPDIDKYEEEELSFNDEDKNRNKSIQEAIAETFRKQSQLIGKRTVPKRKRSRGGPSGGSEEEDEERPSQVNGQRNAVLTIGPHSPRQTSPPARRRGRPRTNYNFNVNNGDVSAGAVEERERQNGNNNNNNNGRGEMGSLRDNLNASPLRAWGKNGVRTRHANNNNSNGSRVSKAARLSRLSEYLRGLVQSKIENEDDMNVIMVPMERSGLVRMGSPYLSCKPSASIGHLKHLVSERTSCGAEQVEICMKKSNELHVLCADMCLQEIRSVNQAHLELVYCVKSGNREGQSA